MKTLFIIIGVIVVLFIAMIIHGRRRVLNHPLGKAALDLGILLDELIEYDKIRLQVEDDIKNGRPLKEIHPKNMNNYLRYTKYLETKQSDEYYRLLKENLDKINNYKG